MIDLGRGHRLAPPAASWRPRGAPPSQFAVVVPCHSACSFTALLGIVCSPKMAFLTFFSTDVLDWLWLSLLCLCRHCWHRRVRCRRCC